MLTNNINYFHRTQQMNIIIFFFFFTFNKLLRFHQGQLIVNNLTICYNTIFSKIIYGNISCIFCIVLITIPVLFCKPRISKYLGIDSECPISRNYLSKVDRGEDFSSEWAKLRALIYKIDQNRNKNRLTDRLSDGYKIFSSRKNPHNFGKNQHLNFRLVLN